jgi:hypothetical protein
MSDTYETYTTNVNTAHDHKGTGSTERILAALEADEARARARLRIETWIARYHALVLADGSTGQIVNYVTDDAKLLLDDIKIILHPTSKSA